MRKSLALVFALVSFFSKSQVICGGSSATLTPTNPQGLGNPSYSLNPGGFTPDPNGNFVVSPNVTSSFTIYTTGTNTANVVNTTSAVVTVTVRPQPLTATTLTQSSCTNSLNSFNLNLTFNPASPAPSYTIAWSTVPMGVLTSTQYSLMNGSVPGGPYSATISVAGGCSLITSFTLNAQPAQAVYSVVPFGSTQTITCSQPTIDLSTTNPAYTYTWSSTSFSPVVSNSISISAINLGTYVVTGQNQISGCAKSYTFNVIQNVSTPTSAITPTLINVTCGQPFIPTVTITATPSVNITHYIYSPQGFTFSANSHTAIYAPPGGSPGLSTYTYVLVNNVSGCTSTKNFTVTSSVGFPTFTVVSPQNFTLGCGTKSVATINLINGNTSPIPGGPISYTLLYPGYTYTPSPIPYPGGGTYTTAIPGTYTAVTHDNASQCETIVQLSVIQLTLGPNISAIVPTQILDCYNGTTTLTGICENTNVFYNWSFPGSPGNQNGAVMTVSTNPAAPTNSLITNYTLTVTDNNNSCKTSSIIPMYQNLFPPKTIITSGVTALTCLTPTITLTNGSTPYPQPLGGLFPPGGPVIGFMWTGPTPQEPLGLSTTYIASTVGTYTLVGMDVVNGCKSFTTINITDNQIYPTVNNPVVPPPSKLDCGATYTVLTPVYTNSTAAYSYSWSSGGKPFPGPPNATTLSIFQVSTPGTYTLVVTNTSSQCKTTAFMSAINGSLISDFSVDHDFGYSPLTVNFINNSLSGSTTTNMTSYWGFGDGTSTGSTSVSYSVQPTKTYSLAGTYTVVLYSRNGTCLDSSSHVIRVEIPSELVIPNVFTPNGDGVNDLFFLKATNLSEINVLIYDRWGHIVFELISQKGNVAWDGKNQYGVEVAEGSYFYIITAKGRDVKEFTQKGTVTVLI